MKRPPDPPEEFFTVAEIAELTRQCSKTVRRAIKSGDLVAQRFGRSVRVSKGAYKIYIKTRKMWST